MALYPKTFPRWDPKRDNYDIVGADHVNLLQEELETTQRHLGLDIHITPQVKKIWYPSTGKYPSGSADLFVAYDGTGFDVVWPSLHDRVINLERAALRDLDANYVSTLGASIVDVTRDGGRVPTTGGVGLYAPADDLQPVLAAFDQLPANASWMASSTLSLWSTGKMVGTSIELTGTYPSRINPTSGAATVLVGSDLRYSAGDKTLYVGGSAFAADSTDSSAKILELGLPANPYGNTIWVSNASVSSPRAVFRIVNSAGGTVFLIDSDGNMTVKSINGKDPGDYDFKFDGLTLDKDGLVFHAGGEYRPGGLILKNGGAFDGHRLQFKNGAYIEESGNKNIKVGAPLTEFTGGITTGMTTYLYEVSGIMYIPVPPYTADHSIQGKYEAPQSKESSKPAYTRKVHIPFEGPFSGGVEIWMSVEVRSYSRPTYVSYSLWDVTGTPSRVFAASDRHACMNNGARFAPDNDTDIDQVRVTNMNLVSGLVPNRKYEIRVECRAASPGYTDREFRWILANKARVLVRPVMTRMKTGVIST